MRSCDSHQNLRENPRVLQRAQCVKQQQQHAYKVALKPGIYVASPRGWHFPPSPSPKALDSAELVEGDSGDTPAEGSTDTGDETLSTISTFSDVTVSQTSLMFEVWLHVIIDAADVIRRP